MTNPRQLVTDGDPEAVFPVPEDDYFRADYLAADDIKKVGTAIIENKLRELDDGELLIDYAWKRQGSVSGGNAILGKCRKLSGVARYYAMGSHFLVEIAADFTRGMTRYQMEALVYHELLHITREEKEDKAGNVTEIVYGTRGHDAELFYDELEEYGLWRRGLNRLADVVQPALPFVEPVREPETVTA